MRSEKSPDGQRTFVDAARRAQLVRCTVEAIAEVGMRKASLAEIARRAGITKGAIFYHFANREELVNEVLVTLLTEGARYMGERIAEQADPAAELRAYLESNIDYIATHRAEVAALVAIAMNHTDERGGAREVDASVYGESLRPLEDILRRGQEQGLFCAFDTRTTAMTIRAAIDAIGPQLSAIPDLDLDRYTTELVALFDRATKRVPA
ncbi:TetR/AcrR family transcriptional regulator [Actinokineospora bangkokensis]|uniref:HTH tetR-type domain-containing protein n=1 Tax=Actinokineospora bangkokensis TaxID=1193682 RepID=A0A1Q9LDH1_9PSEU|nr:TetR/AcrR family transcriptional regulator [Actinokineospora bangkokensis]OLR90054.1 hypothetical protein BJP25_03495 [Actinokineospora bangkokensis]